MTNDEYKDFVMGKLRNDTDMNMLLHATMGISGEAGEVSELIKKHAFYGRDLNEDRLLDELGDVLFYIIAVATLRDISLDAIVARNVEKLSERYQ